MQVCQQQVVLIPLRIRSISTNQPVGSLLECRQSVLIPLRIRSISTPCWLNQLASSQARLNPFENQVYFHLIFSWYDYPHRKKCLNPFENQVYFHHSDYPITECTQEQGLNPFENQVYFHRPRVTSIRQRQIACLNPFENQVYFHPRPSNLARSPLTGS